MLIKILNIIGGLLLLFYPFVLVANVMSLAGERDTNAPILSVISAYLFLVISTLYPISCIVSWKCNPSCRLSIALIPYFNIVLAIILFTIWQKFS